MGTIVFLLICLFLFFGRSDASPANPKASTQSPAKKTLRFGRRKMLNPDRDEDLDLLMAVGKMDILIGPIADHVEHADYQADLGNLTCTCFDWKTRRHAFSIHSPARACHHIRSGLASRGGLIVQDKIAPRGQDATALTFFVEAGGDAIWKGEREYGSGTVYFSATPGSGQIEVYARRRRSGESIHDQSDFSGPYRRFAWEISAQQWSGDKRPDAARAIRKLLRVVEEDLLRQQWESAP